MSELLSPDILHVIRTETRTWHSQVEQLVPVFEGGFGISDYKNLLERFYGFYAGFEPEVEGWASLRQIFPDWDDRRKLPWLEDDLRWLGLQRQEISELPVCSRLPELRSAAAIFGALYVTEGSTLGGQVICRQLSHALHLAPGRGASFFYGHGAETGSRWKGFTRALCEFAAAGTRTFEVQREMVDSAVATFKSIGRWLSLEEVIQETPKNARITA
jgi:heme oxygenase